MELLLTIFVLTFINRKGVKLVRLKFGASIEPYNLLTVKKIYM